LGDAAPYIAENTALYGLQCGIIARLASKMIDAYIDTCMHRSSGDASDTDASLN
jgi:hypothetical protein